VNGPNAALLAILLGLTAPGAAKEPVRRADVLIINGHVVAMDASFRVIERGTVAVAGSRIVAVGGPEVAARFEAKLTIDAAGDIVMPGWQHHTHASMTIFMVWRRRRSAAAVIFPLEAMVERRQRLHGRATRGG
jgi:predicted amidohydrolase YtcJ